MEDNTQQRKYLFVAGSFSSTNSFFFLPAFFHTVSETVFSNFFEDENCWPKFAFWAVHTRTILLQNLLCDSFRRGTVMPCHKVWTIELSILTAAHSSFSWEHLSRIKWNLCSKAICHPQLFSDCSYDDWSVPWFWSGTLTVRRTVGDFAV